jgi:hypothetical protein
MVISLFVFLVGFAELSAWATTGNELRDICQIAARNSPQGNLELAKATNCQGFVEAVVLVGRHMREADRFCPPDGVTVGQAINVLVKYLNENADKTHQGGEVLAIAAFGKAWPCN